MDKYPMSEKAKAEMGKNALVEAIKNTGVVDREMQGLIDHVLRMGSTVNTRNSVVRRLINHCIVFSSTPLLSLRATAWKNALREWEWFMSGSNDINTLHPSVRSWWQPWADDSGKVAANYSHQFRHWRGMFDQIECMVHGIRKHPFSRRNVITTWDTMDMDTVSNDPKGITNCHGTVIQAFVEPKDNSLTLVTYQRSVDIICGVPHNWIQYWAFLLWLAHKTGRAVGELHWIGGDCHIYGEHQAVSFRMLDQTGKLDKIKTPNLVYAPTSEAFKADDFTLDGEYCPLITERVPMIV